MFSRFLEICLICIISRSGQVKAKIPLLIFPPTSPTRTQWISGIGIPLEDLRFEAMTTGYVLKAEYFLPDHVDDLRIRRPMAFVRNFNGEMPKFEKFLANANELPANATKRMSFLRKSQRVFTSYRWSVYMGMEGLANRMGLNGRDCVLKSICEAAENPFHYFNGLFAELLHILLTPSSSADKISQHSDNEYFHAEHIGSSGGDCSGVFKNCPRSLLDHFSNFHTMTEGIMRTMG